jgi:hypothetical protein
MPYDPQQDNGPHSDELIEIALKDEDLLRYAIGDFNLTFSNNDGVYEVYYIDEFSKNEDEFSYVFTFDEFVSFLDKNFKWLPGEIWATLNDRD